MIRPGAAVSVCVASYDTCRTEVLVFPASNRESTPLLLLLRCVLVFYTTCGVVCARMICTCTYDMVFELNSVWNGVISVLCTLSVYLNVMYVLCPLLSCCHEMRCNAPKQVASDPTRQSGVPRRETTTLRHTAHPSSQHFTAAEAARLQLPGKSTGRCWYHTLRIL